MSDELTALDPITALGFALKRPIPKGDAFDKWALEKGGLEEIISALRRSGYSGNRLARAMFDLTHGKYRMTLNIDTPSAQAALDGRAA